MQAPLSVFSLSVLVALSSNLSALRSTEHRFSVIMAQNSGRPEMLVANKEESDSRDGFM